MKSNKTGLLVLSVILLLGCLEKSERLISHRIDAVIRSDGLIAFWDFDQGGKDNWVSRGTEQAYPIYLRQVGDSMQYSLSNWPYRDEQSKIIYDHAGPFGKAVRFNQGFIYGSIPRKYFETEALNLHGTKPFTIIAWIKFIGQRHFVAGIWDEGGWHKYAGRRQVALFGGLFNQMGVIAHVSQTGAASFPQSDLNGSQYARLRAIDSMPFQNNRWVAMAMTFDPEHHLVTAFLNGKANYYSLIDPITQDVYPQRTNISANPLAFSGPIYSPRVFTIKYNGYNIIRDGVNEHRLLVNLDAETLRYESDRPETETTPDSFRIKFDIVRSDRSLLVYPVVMPTLSGQSFKFPLRDSIIDEDMIISSIEVLETTGWTQIGTGIKSTIHSGAPFTFGRAMGLGLGEIEHGSQIFIDGVAIYNRVLSAKELERLCFIGGGSAPAN